jgi:hypothetical protein
MARKIQALLQLRVPLDSRVALLARKSDLLVQLDAGREQWPVHQDETDAQREAAIKNAEVTGILIGLYVLGYISEEEYREQYLQGKLPVIDTTLSPHQATKAMYLLCHPDQGTVQFCKENRITNLQDWTHIKTIFSESISSIYHCKKPRLLVCAIIAGTTPDGHGGGCSVSRGLCVCTIIDSADSAVGSSVLDVAE